MRSFGLESAHGTPLFLPTPLLSMISWALVFAADIVAELEARVKKLRMKEMMGDSEREINGEVRTI